MGVMVDSGGKVRKGESPLRTCVVTRAERPQSELVRFVLDPCGAVVPDLARKLPGRGVWVTLSRDAVAKAVKTRAFSRSLKTDAKAADDLPALVEDQLLRRVLSALSLANKAGLVVAGNAKVDAAITSGTALAILHASDASDDGAEKLDRRYRAMCRDAELQTRIVRALTNAQLSLALGRANVVHAALMTGGATAHFLRETDRLLHFTTGASDVEGSSTA